MQQAKQKKRPKTAIQLKTQDTLIREALELEERNVASLKEFLAREEEKKRHARVVKANVEPPMLRWISRVENVGVRPGIVVVEPPEATDVGLDSHMDDPSPGLSVASTTTPHEPNAVVVHGSTPDISSSSEIPAPDTNMARTADTCATASPKGSHIHTAFSSVASTALHNGSHDSPSTELPVPPMEKDTRNYVIVELPFGSTKGAEMKALFGNQTAWGALADARREELKQQIASELHTLPTFTPFF